MSPTPPTVGRPTIQAQMQALAKKLIAGPINLDETTDIEDRILSKMEEADLVDMGSHTARLTDKGRAFAGGGSIAAAPAVAAPQRRAAARAVEADPAGIVWEELPDAGRGRVHWFEQFKPHLIAKPGKWARVMASDERKETCSRASSLRLRFKAAKEPFEAVARSLPDGRGAVYARFVGKAKA
jgi:hypothetical protein